MTPSANHPTEATSIIDVPTLQAWLADGGEIAFVDIREEGIHGEGHPLLAVNIPYSRLELAFPLLVPRPATRIVLLAEDGAAGEAIGPRAARRLAELGYSAVHVLKGGAEAWTAAGEPLFPSTNVPSKAFAECVEHAFHTPDIEAAELDQLRRTNSDVIVLDTRTSEEFGRFHVPGAISAPGAELVHRFAELVPSPETFVVVSCAGRTRGIIGAQALINAGVPNRVAALSGGTQGWRLAGLDLERDTRATPQTPLAPAAREAARQLAAGVAARFGVPVIDLAAFARLRDLLAPLHHALFLESNPIPLKAALCMVRLCTGELRLPLTRAAETTRDRLATVLAGVLAVEEEAAGKRRLALVR